MDKKIAISQSRNSPIWPWKMAWRDSRRSRSKLVLFIASISLGIAALVGITSFRENLMDEINNQSKELLGADFAVRGNEPLPNELFFSFRNLSGKESKETYFSSMVYFPRTDGTRLTQVRALEGGYPYYGQIETEPANAAMDFREGKFAIVDEKLLIQYSVELGDSVLVGGQSFEVIGKIKKVPGQTGIGSSIAPIVYIPMQYLDQTGLIQKGSRVNYLTYFQFHPDIDTTNLWQRAVDEAESSGYDVETIEERKNETGEAFRDLSSFLEVIAFAALLLGCLGVASSIYVYSRGKIQTVAVLRCLGLKARQAINIFLIQIMSFGLIGAVIGSSLGVVMHVFLPGIVNEFIPINVEPTIYWPAIISGIAIGLCISLLFGLLSLVGLRRISPLSAVRFGYSSMKNKIDPVVLLLGIAIVLFLDGALWWQLKEPVDAAIYTAILLGSLGVLYLIGKLISWSVRRFMPSSFPFVWRQGMSNLHRPNNQTVILIMTLGLSTAFLAMLYFMQDLLVQRVSLAGADERANTVLYDIQSSQKDEVRTVTLDYDLPVMQEVPIVTMRLKEINGNSKKESEIDSLNYPDWAYNREYRITYRDHLIDSETLVEGEWTDSIANKNDSIFISISKGFAENLSLKLGDELLFNVQGALIKTYIGSFRDIDWRRVQTNFLVVFPNGVLEKAPQFHVLITRVGRSDLSARYQQAIVRMFPNVSVIDLELILKTVEDILAKVAFVIQFMALFSIGTGIIVMISAIVLSRFHRVKENVLLRTLGASKKQLWQIIAAEYFLLGALGAFTGILLAIVFTTLMGHFVFEFVFIPNIVHMLSIFVMITTLTVVIGIFNSRKIVSESPLEILRNEG
jgi:putative ABC transport system permease protein